MAALRRNLPSVVLFALLIAGHQSLAVYEAMQAG